jgi:hypothetical protein
MKKSPLQEAVMLFKENEMLFGDVKQDKEKANFYRGLALLAEELGSINKRLQALELNEVDISDPTRV